MTMIYPHIPQQSDCLPNCPCNKIFNFEIQIQLGDTLEVFGTIKVLGLDWIFKKKI